MDARLGVGDICLTMSKGYGSVDEFIHKEADGTVGDAGKYRTTSV